MLAQTAPTIRPLSVNVGAVRVTGDPTDRAARIVDDAANPLRAGYPRPIASYTWRSDDPWNAIDGKIWFDEIPENTRWTNYSSPNQQDWYGVDFGLPTAVSDVRFFGYDDGGGVRPAAAFRLQYWTRSAWIDVPGQSAAPTRPVGNGLNRITFPTLTTDRLRLLFTNPAGGFVGVTELQAWSRSSDALSVRVGSTDSVAVDGPTPVSITLRTTTTHDLRRVTTSVAAPAGWTVTRPATIPSLAAGARATLTVTLTPPADGPGGTLVAVVATSTYLGRAGVPLTTHARQTVRTSFPAGQADPVGSWSLDEGSGSVAHDTAGGHDAALVGGPSWVGGVAGSALQFDGATQYAQTSGPVLDTVGNFSVAAWVRLDSTSRFATAVSQDGTTTSGFFVQYSAADQRFAFSTGEGRALADAAPTTGRRYHLVGVHDANAGTYTLYVDGQAQAAVSHQAQGDAATGPLAIGRAFAGGGRADYWPGPVDAVHVWNRVLSAADVSALYAARD